MLNHLPSYGRVVIDAVRRGAQVMHRPEPMSLSDWANENFYLSSESSYTEGRWETLPFQVAIMNAISHDEVEVVNWVKSARVGYSKVIVAALGYFTEHKSRNQLLFQPRNGDAEGFMKTQVETMIRDVPVVKSLAPWIGKKHKDNTLEAKRFSNGKKLWVVGGESAKNYREKSPDNVFYDELAGFNDDVEKEGSPTFLGDKRIEGSVFPKSIRGSTPKITGQCQISKVASEADCFFYFNLPCPHCDGEQVLEWGGKGCEYGIKWINDDPNTAAYACKHCSSLISNNDLIPMQWRALKSGEPGAWRSECGAWTKDGINFYRDDQRIDAPLSVSFHIWTAYSPFTTWSRIVRDFMRCKGDPSKLKTFVNTTLGQTWDEDFGEKKDPDLIYSRREHYLSEVPIDNCILTAAVDVQDDRLEVLVKAWTEEEESYAITYKRFFGDLSRPEVWQVLHRYLETTFKTPSGLILDIRMSCIDSGGHYTDEVYKFCKAHGVQKYVPIKGYSQPGKPIAVWPRKANSKGVYLVMVGADSAKEMTYSRLGSMEPGGGYIHYPVSEEFDRAFFEHLLNERKITKYVNGRKVSVWDAGGRRNEPFDLENYNLAAIRLLQQHFGVDLKSLHRHHADKKPITRKKSSFL